VAGGRERVGSFFLLPHGFACLFVVVFLLRRFCRTCFEENLGRIQLQIKIASLLGHSRNSTSYGLSACFFFSQVYIPLIQIITVSIFVYS
jgi:hypothetical protein